VFTRLEVKDFFSIKEAALDLYQNGATLIVGSNGAGKSSTFEALVWALYGKTIRDIPSDDYVIRNDAKGAQVNVLLTIEGKHYSIHRRRDRGNPAHLSVLDENGEEMFMASSVTEKTKLLGQWLKCDYDTFCNTVYFPQGRFTSFTQANDEGRKKIFDQILGTDYFKQLEGLAKSHRNLQREKFESLAAKLEKYKETVVRLTDEIQEIHKERDDLEQLKATKLSSFQTELNAYNTQAAVISVERDEKKQELEKLLQHQVLVKQDLENYAKASMKKGVLLVKKQSEHRRLQDAFSNRKVVEDRIRRYGELITEGKCPTCLQRMVDEDSIKAVLDEQSEALDRIDEIVAKQHEIVDALNLDIADTECEVVRLSLSAKEAQAVDKAVKQCKDELDTVSNSLSNQQSKVQMSKLMLSTIEENNKEQVERLETRSREKQTELEQTRKAGSLTQKALGSTEADISRADFWVDGFGSRGLRSLIIEGVLPYINKQANLYCNKLTDGKIMVEVSATTQLKSGESRERISISAINEDGSSVYGGNSGGERKRIDFAVLLALQSLVAERVGMGIGLIVLDEVLDELDDDGIERAIDIVKELGQTRPVFLISHNDSVKNQFEDIISVSKSGGVSSVAVS
jgi:DNA repair exonuclease SbcCD ATPase subunit